MEESTIKITIKGKTYEVYPTSRVERLLKQILESGAGGGGGSGSNANPLTQAEMDSITNAINNGTGGN